jgi:hypothetical protein
MIFKIFSPKKSRIKLAFLTQNKAKSCKIWIITLIFEKNANFFRRKLSKIAENCDHNIDPWSRCPSARGLILKMIFQLEVIGRAQLVGPPAWGITGASVRGDSGSSPRVVTFSSAKSV